MPERTEVEKCVIKEMSNLLDFGFSGPVVTHEKWTSKIDWLGDEIAIEMELDWRELEIFCLLVRLEDGHLPDGYYVSNGRPCRYHLQKVIQMRHWPVDKDAMHEISDHSKDRSFIKDKETMKQRVQSYKTVLSSSLQNIISEGKLIFQVS
jgi:hypothetical protein